MTGEGGMSTMSKKKFAFWLSLMIFMCMICAGCTTEKEETANKDVYVFYGSYNTTSDWRESQYGAISHAGELILPLETRQIEIIRDEKTGQQLWLQTREVEVDDPTLSAEELYTDENWEHIRNYYKLYDLKGNLLKDLGERAVLTVYGDLVLYNDDKLENRDTDQIYFSDVNELYAAEGHYVMDCNDFTSLRITDENLQVLHEIEGSGRLNGTRIIVQQDGAMGMLALDGTEILPFVYDSIQYASGKDKCIVQQGEQSSVLSLADGSSLYTTSAAETEISYADDHLLVLRSYQILQDGSREARTQMYNYQGEPISDVYSYISSEAENGIYEKGKDYLFSANTLDGISILLNQKGEVVYTGKPDEWLNLVGAEEVIVAHDNGDGAELQNFAGEIKNTKLYEYLYPVYLSSQNGGYSQKAPLVLGNYTYKNTMLQDLVNLEGNILIEQAKTINALAEDRFWVEKGFSQGLMDEKGQWLYEQSLFDASVDE